MEAISYIPFPLHGLRYLHENRKGALHDALSYAVNHYMERYSYDVSDLAGYYSLRFAEDIEEDGESVASMVRHYKDATPHLHYEVWKNYYFESKSIRELDYLAFDLAIVSILGENKYKVSNYDYILSRAMGYKNPEDVPAYSFLNKVQKEFFNRYTTPKRKVSKPKMRRVLNEMETANFRVLCLTEKQTGIKMRGLLIGRSPKTNYEEMLKYILSKKPLKDKIKELNDKKESAISRVNNEKK